MVPPVVVSPFSKSVDALPSVKDGVALTCKAASTPEEVDIHMEIRNRIFVQEQGFFAGSDRDVHDDDPRTVHALGLLGAVAGGAVRLYPLDEPGVWKGDRLAVLPRYRRMLGAKLVRFAVKTAGERGGGVMIAHVQPQNVDFFRYLGWTPEGDLMDFQGHLHQKMSIPLQRPDGQ
ncbi:MAG TPA: MSMEG_0567/Sll0786 family nitrogen starvation N-acetyltransferase [Actinomycetota bacterium]|nr:MSMEG_0567/Sll0786 family nitrogen starvation N-acetyltransferase [Actinomycetota bacterium]